MPEAVNQITDCIVHRLIKEQYQREAALELRTAPLEVNESVQRLIDHLSKLYSGRAGKGYGRFEDNEDEYPTQKYLRLHLVDGETDFLAFSNQLMERLKIEAAKEHLATGGYVLIAKITTGASSYLLVAIVTEVVGSAITEGLDVVDSVHLDMSHLRVAGRIDLTAWQAGAERYISFLKGRSEIADYFKLFLGCNDILKPVEETRKLVAALEQFATERNLEGEARDQFLERAYQYLVDLDKNTPVSLEALSNHVWPDEPDTLQQKLADEELGLSDGFVPDRRVARGLVKFEGKTAFWKLSFERSGLRNGHIRYDEEHDTIILSGIPDDLRQELIEERNPDDD